MPDLEQMVRVVHLFDIYGSLLTSRQQDMIFLYYYQDLSLSEIAEEYGITRQAVHDALKRSVIGLEEYEEKLKFLEHFTELEESIEELEVLVGGLNGEAEKLIRTKIAEINNLTQRFKREV